MLGILRPTHFDVKEEAETLKNVASDSDATAFASIVFPLPGGPNKSNPELKTKNLGAEVEMSLIHEKRIQKYTRHLNSHL